MSLEERGRQCKRYPVSSLSISVVPHDSYPRIPSGRTASPRRPSGAKYDSEFGSPPRSPLLAHPKVRSKLREVDVEEDRLDRACGQSPLGSPTASYFTHPAYYSDVHNECHPVPPDARHVSACLPRPLSPKRSHQSLRSSASEPLSLREQLLDVEDPPPAPPSFLAPDATGVLRSLVKVLRAEGKQIRDYIEIEDMLEAKEREARERENRLMETKIPPEEFRVFGAPLKDAVFYTSTPTVLGGYQHELPNVVFTCIEELYRTGIYQPGLFRILPTRGRLAALMDAFDARQRPLLRHEAMPDICAVLMMYFDRLPEPLLSRALFNALWNWCVKPTNMREDERRAAALAREEAAFDRHAHAHALPNPLTAKHRWRKRAVSEPAPPPEPAKEMPQQEREEDVVKLERGQIAAAQLVLRLLQPEAFSLLLYLCAFFTQIPLCPDNGLAFEDIARLFAGNLLGGPSKSAATTMMVWLLSRWDRIADGLIGRQRGRVEMEAQKKQRQDGESPEMVRGRSTSIAAPERKPTRSRSRERRRPTMSSPPEDDLKKARATSKPRHNDRTSPGVGLSKPGLGRGDLSLSHLHGTRPYSLSVSSDASTSTFVSTSSSEPADPCDYTPPDLMMMTRDGREKIGAVLPVVNEYESLHHHFNSEDRDIMSGSPDSEASVPLPSEGLFRMDRLVYSSDSDSACESDDEHSTIPYEVSKLRAGEKLASNNPTRRSSRSRNSPYRPSPLRDMTTGSGSILPALSTTTWELCSARARISELEHALAMEHCRSRGRSSSAPYPETRAADNDDCNIYTSETPGYSDDKDSILEYYVSPDVGNADGGFGHMRGETQNDCRDDVHQRLQEALAERDSARKLVQQFRKAFEDADEMKI
ncbi:hypothetical protein OBBRIDRAFT_838570 [Obba rivulosa]|uniref:Rho-GAP domain-containing protein n=1 Tax=Obba rivulosa TaxID=1052685 RepID=A0A8E2DGG1_9APHY|nr:hypothetical protein OBBRIDRAFT_838570 [Obba rivulosa]